MGVPHSPGLANRHPSPSPRRDRLHATLAHLNVLPSMLADLGSSVEHLTQRITKQREVLVQQRQKSDDARAKVKTCKECLKKRDCPLRWGGFGWYFGGICRDLLIFRVDFLGYSTDVNMWSRSHLALFLDPGSVGFSSVQPPQVSGTWQHKWLPNSEENPALCRKKWGKLKMIWRLKRKRWRLWMPPSKVRTGYHQIVNILVNFDEPMELWRKSWIFTSNTIHIEYQVRMDTSGLQSELDSAGDAGDAILHQCRPQCCFGVAGTLENVLAPLRNATKAFDKVDKTLRSALSWWFAGWSGDDLDLGFVVRSSVIFWSVELLISPIATNMFVYCGLQSWS